MFVDLLFFFVDFGDLFVGELFGDVGLFLEVYGGLFGVVCDCSE